MGKSTISMAIFNSYVSLPEGTCTKEIAQSSYSIIQAVSIQKKQFAGRLNKPKESSRIVAKPWCFIPGDARMILAIISQSWRPHQVMRVNFNRPHRKYIIGDFPVIVPTPS